LGRPRKQSREPFWFEDRQAYYVTVGTTKKRLSPDRDEAWRLWHELMARPPEQPERPRIPTGPDAEAIEVLDAFLDWCQRNKAKRTYQWYRENIQRFVAALPDGLKASELKPYHLTRAMEPYAHWANNTKHDFISAVKRAFSWAVDEELIDRNPIGRVKKPTREPREFAVQPDEYAEILETIADPNFRDLVEMAWEKARECRSCGRSRPGFEEYGQRALLAEKNEGVDWKAMMHATRVCREAEELLLTHTISYPRPEAVLLLQIRKGELPYRQVAELLEAGMERLEECQRLSTLPEEPDRAFGEQMAVSAYRASVLSETP